jgi:MFS family permease
MSVPVSEVGKHFFNEKRTVATGIVTAAASVGYFLAPLFTQYTLGAVGWEQTLKYFMYFIAIGLFASIFLLPSKTIINSSQADRDQTFTSAIKEAN